MNCLLGVVREGEDDRCRDGGVASQLSGVPPPVLGVYGACDQEYDAVDGEIGAYDNGEVAGAHRASVRWRPEYVLAPVSQEAQKLPTGLARTMHDNCTQRAIFHVLHGQIQEFGSALPGDHQGPARNDAEGGRAV